MKKIYRLTLKTALLAAVFSSSLLAGNAQAYDNYDDDFNDVFSAIIPIIVYEAITRPRVIVRERRIIREGYLKPRYGRKIHKHRKHRRSVSRDHYRYDRYRHPQRGRHHGHF